MNKTDEKLMTGICGICFLVLIAIFLSPFFILAYGIEATTCKITGNELKMKTKYSFFAGCIVEKPNGQKVLLEQMRNLQ